jgi:hypothetical protein
MGIVEENWKVLASLFPAGWQQMAWQSNAVERLRGFTPPEVLLSMLMLHVARGCCRPVACSTKERPCDSIGSSTLAL